MPTRQRKSVVKPSRWKSVLVLVAVVAMVYILIAGDHGLIRLWQTDEDLREWETRVQELQAHNDSLRTVLLKLEIDLDYIEKVAREEYGMAKKDERVYRIRRSLPEEE